MKNITLKSLLFFVFMLCSLYITAQGALPSSDIFRLKNVATGQFLTTAVGSAQPVTMTNLAEEDISTHWTFVLSGAYYNIDSEIESGGTGILRAPGVSGPGGPYVVVSTTKAPPASDTDKTWTIYHNSTNDTYRIGSRTTGRFMYHEVNGTVTHAEVADTDDRSNWELIPFVETPVVVAPDEDTGTDLSCSPEFQNDTTRNVDIQNPVNVGTADDRSCYSDYSESDVYGKTWGVYNITDGSNHWDGATLQPRIERSLPRSGETGVGSYARFTGTFRILEVGETGNFNTEGSYIAQAKGKHDTSVNPNGSADPAICLYLAKPVMGTGINAGKQVAFDIYAERILERGGEGSGREEVLLLRVNKNEEIAFELEVGFAEDPSDSTKKIHYCNAVFNGTPFNWNIPEPEIGLESGIRYGAYRVKGGRAQLRWADTTYQMEEIVDSGDDIPSGFYRLKNVATGKYLMSSGSTIVASDTGEGSDKEWQFVPAGVSGFNYYNIDSQVKGIIRFLGGSSAPELVSTNFAPPNTTTDKIWTIIENTDETYSFEARDTGRYLYHAADNSMTHSANTDDRSKWILESTTLGLDDRDLKAASIKIYPNPAKDEFTIALQNINSVKRIEIYNILGKRVYQNTLKDNTLEVKNAGFKSGVYLVKAFSDDNQVFHSKLVIK